MKKSNLFGFVSSLVMFGAVSIPAWARAEHDDVIRSESAKKMASPASADVGHAPQRTCQMSCCSVPANEVAFPVSRSVSRAPFHGRAL